jgi:hypothetical protein
LKDFFYVSVFNILEFRLLGKNSYRIYSDVIVIGFSSQFVLSISLANTKLLQVNPGTVEAA